MASESSHRPTFDIDTGLQRRGVGLLAVGGLLALVGAAMSMYGLIDATRRWMQQLDEPPSAVARRRWAQVRTASSAGAEAWHHHGGSHGAESTSAAAARPA